MLQTTTKPTATPTGLTAAVASVALAVGMVGFDLFTDPRLNTGLLYAIPLLGCFWVRSRRFCWILGVTLAIMATVGFFVFDAPRMDHQGDIRYFVVNRLLATGMLLVLTAALDTVMVVIRRLDETSAEIHHQNQDLEARNEELAQSEEEIARQNEELQSQTEELERQSEELRVANEDLAEREQMLAALLDLSRSLTLEIDHDETLERICQTLGQLVNGPHTATAIILRKGDVMEVRCHYGFGSEGVDREQIPLKSSFAELVMGEARTGYIEDLTLRTDLVVPQPKNGEPVLSVLAAPLRVHGQTIGTIEVYCREKRTWSEEQINLIESLASQTSISLENTALYRENETERRRLETVLETVPFPVFICGTDCGSARLNIACTSLLGLPQVTSVRSIVTGDKRWTMYRDGKEIDFDNLSIVRAARGTFVQAEEKELVFHSGRRLNLLMSAAPIRDRDNTIIGAVCVAADVTEMTQLHRELDRRRREAEEASVRKSRFLAAASHDIRTPANAVGLIAELIKRSAGNPGMMAEVPQLADELHRSAQALVVLVNNVLDITRFENGQIELHESDFELGALLTEEFRQMLPLAQEKGLRYAMEEPESPIWVRADRVKLGRIMGNLLGNAIKFTDAGSVTLKVTPIEKGVTLAVTDTGVGIHAEHVQHIFDEFYQLSEPHRSKGSGLGLAIVKRLVEAMGASIAVTSEPGKGSTFTVILPPSTIIPARDASRH